MANVKKPTYYYDGEGLTRIRRWLDEKSILHRWGGPAIENPSGTKIWITHGRIEYEDGRSMGPMKRIHTNDKEWGMFGDPNKKNFRFPGYDTQ
jgi:hypothetical protein